MPIIFTIEQPAPNPLMQLVIHLQIINKVNIIIKDLILILMHAITIITINSSKIYSNR